MRRKTKAKRVLDREDDEDEEEEEGDPKRHAIDVRTPHGKVLCVCNSVSFFVNSGETAVCRANKL